jgi:glutamate-1-semialdehyde aminotransferase
MGVGCCALGYANPVVDNAVKAAIDRGNMCTLNCPEEVDLAARLIGLHPWADNARFARGGGEAMAIAVRIARAYNGDDTILFCGYHGWHDWYLAANLGNEHALDGQLLPGLNPAGVPRALRDTVKPFTYNDVEGFKQLWDSNLHIGAVVMEPVRSVDPSPAFLSTIRKYTLQSDVPLIVDEVTAGWRLCVGGAHLHYHLEPDIAVFAKALGNGHPISAVIGRSEVMQAAQSAFISSTCWTERCGPAAALATINEMQACNLPAHLIWVGTWIQKAWRQIADFYDLAIEITGIPPLAHFAFNGKGLDPLVLKTLFTQSMLEQGFLASTSLYASLAHTRALVSLYLKAVDVAFHQIAEAIKTGHPEMCLLGAPCHATFKRLV